MARFTNTAAALIATAVIYGVMAVLIHYGFLHKWGSVINGFVSVLIYRSIRDSRRLDDMEGK